MSSESVEAWSGGSGRAATPPTAGQGGEGLRVVTLRPRRSLGWSIGLPLAALVLPLLGVALWIGSRPGDEAPYAMIGVIVGIILVAVVVALLQYRRTLASISPNGIVERGFFGGTRTIAARDIAGVLRVQLYRGASAETSSQLFVIDRSDRTAFRMRGEFWDDETMDLVAPVLGVDEVVREQPVTMAELRAENPRLLYWFERGFAKA